MVRIGKFEVNVLTCTESQAKRKDWVSAKEYSVRNCNTYEQGCYASKYIVAPQATDSGGSIAPTAFAIQFKLHGSLSEQFMNGADLIVFRVYHDDKRIGSSHVKRRDWERELTYTVRKSSRRFWLEDQGGWARLNWHLEEGLHGQLRVEVWRQIESHSYSGSWDAGLDIPVRSYGDVDYIDYTDPAVGVAPGKTRVRFTKRLDDDPGAQPDAQFVFEYRPEDTMKTIGVITNPLPIVAVAPVAPIYDLTQDDYSWAGTSTHQIYDLSESPTESPSRTISSTYTSDDLWGHSSMPSNDNYSSTEPMQYSTPFGLSAASIPSDHLYMQEPVNNGFPMSHARQERLSVTHEPPEIIYAHKHVIDLTIDD